MTVPTDLLIPFNKSTAQPHPPPWHTRVTCVYLCWSNQPSVNTLVEQVSPSTAFTCTAVKYPEVKDILQGWYFGFGVIMKEKKPSVFEMSMKLLSGPGHLSPQGWGNRLHFVFENFKDMFQPFTLVDISFHYNVDFYFYFIFLEC